MAIPFLLVVIFFAVFILLLFHRHESTSRKGRSPPGPPGLPFIGNLHQFDTAAPHISLYQLSKKYGPLMSMKLGSVPALVISSPRIAKEALKTHDLVFSSRPKLSGMNKLSYNGLDIAFSPYSDSWRELRKISVVHLLSNKRVQSFQSVREEEVFRMIENIRIKASSGEAINLSALALSLTSASICRTAFGGSASSSCDVGGSSRFDEIMYEVQAMLGGFFVSDYLPLLSWVDKLSGMVSRLEKAYKNMDSFYQGLIHEHLDPSCRPKSAGDPTNILEILIQLKEENSDLTWNCIKATLMNIFVAGTDTSGATIIWTMTALMKYPSAMEKLQKEIRELVGVKGRVNEDDLPKLPYLKAVIKESMRLYPATPLLVPRETLEKCIIEGYTIEPKTLIYVNAWAIARDPEYWDAPDEFVPERFLNTTVDIIGQDFQVIPFGAGRRGCPGISMGLAAVEIALANLVYSFDWELPPGMEKEDIDTEALPGITMHKKIPLCLVPKKYKCV